MRVLIGRLKTVPTHCYASLATTQSCLLIERFTHLTVNVIPRWQTRAERAVAWHTITVEKIGVPRRGSPDPRLAGLQHHRAWGMDLTTERTPLESGLDLFVKTEDREFIGRDSMLRRAQDPERWSMALLELDEAGCDPFYSHIVFEQGEPIGMVTSGGYGYGVNRVLALALFRAAPTNGQNLRVLILDQPVPARVLDVAPYDPDNVRLRA